MTAIANLPDLRPSLLLDFANSGRVDPRMQSTRASAATCFGPDGKLRTVAANVPRIDYDPVTGSCLGLLLEEARTNLWLNSATAAAAQSFTVTAQTYALSFEGGGTLVLTGAYAGSSSTAVLRGGRKHLVFTPSAGTLTCTPAGDVKNVQLEAGSFSTSYIPTEGSAATRAAYAATLQLPAELSKAGAVVCSFRHYNGSITDTTILCIDDGTETQNSQHAIRTSNGGMTIRYTPRGSGVTIMDIGIAVADLGAKTNVGFRFGGGNFSGALGGVLAGPVASDKLVPDVKRLRLGQRGSVNAVRMTGYIERIAIYTGPITDAQLQRLTA